MQKITESKKICWIDFIFCYLLGWCGVHKFYRKNLKFGLLYLFTFGLFGIGWISDTIGYFKMLTLNSTMNSTYKNTFKIISLTLSIMIALFMLLVCLTVENKEFDLIIFILISTFAFIIMPLNIVLFGVIKIAEKTTLKLKNTNKGQTQEINHITAQTESSNTLSTKNESKKVNLKKE